MPRGRVFKGIDTDREQGFDNPCLEALTFYYPLPRGTHLGASSVRVP